MPHSGVNQRALQRWSLVQSAIWLPILALIPWQLASPSPITEALREAPPIEGPFFEWLLLGILLTSYLWLWVVLRAGRTAADWVTLARFLGLVAFAVSAVSTRELSWFAWSVALIVVVADLFDGWVARKYGGSEGGAVLDMETDQFSTLVLAITATSFAGSGIWTLGLPAFKYVFVLAMTSVSIKSTDPKPQEGNNNRGRTICAVVLGLLLASNFPAFSPAFRGVTSAVAILLLAYSFSSDAAFLWRHARRASAPN